ncbi:MAG: hypothetical protein AB4372_12550 [Xenococcus sp. (in: cyanobacteria)]
MANIQVEIQGNDAIAASEELFSLAEISGNWQTVDDTEKDATLVTIGAIVGIIGGTMAAAEQIRKWYQE